MVISVKIKPKRSSSQVNFPMLPQAHPREHITAMVVNSFKKNLGTQKVKELSGHNLFTINVEAQIFIPHERYLVRLG